MHSSSGTDPRSAAQRDASTQEASIVSAANALSARWAAAAPEDGRCTVFSGAGVWPLLGLLALGAAGPTRQQLAAAFGLDVAHAEGAVRRLLGLFDASQSMYAAFGLWQHADVTLYPAWRDSMPPGTRGELTGDPAVDQGVLDAWARDQTHGMIERAPVSVSPQTVLMLASAVSVQTEWVARFVKRRAVAGSGPWRGRAITRLEREAQAQDIVRVDGPAGPVTVARVAGRADLDVYLLLGTEQAGAARTLTAGLGALSGIGERVPVERWSGSDPAPGARVEPITNATGRPELHLACTAFDVRARHDLLVLPQVFGLAYGGDYPGIGVARGRQLGVQQAAQAAMAQFTEHGFKAAAVTMTDIFATGLMRPAPHKPTTRTTVAYDRPFGFAAVHRASGLIPIAGWVGQPAAP